VKVNIDLTEEECMALESLLEDGIEELMEEVTELDLHQDEIAELVHIAKTLRDVSNKLTNAAEERGLYGKKVNKIIVDEFATCCEDEEKEYLTQSQLKGLMAILRSKGCYDVFFSGNSLVAKSFYDKHHKLRSAVFETMEDVEAFLGVRAVGILREHG